MSSLLRTWKRSMERRDLQDEAIEFLAEAQNKKEGWSFRRHGESIGSLMRRSFKTMQRAKRRKVDPYSFGKED